MAWSLDARIPVTLWTDAAPPPADAEVVVLAEAGHAAAGMAAFDTAGPHPAACACCTGRSDAALALDRLFQARVRGTLPWFRRVVALVPSESGQAAIRAALVEDTLTAARFRTG